MGIFSLFDRHYLSFYCAVNKEHPVLDHFITFFTSFSTSDRVSVSSRSVLSGNPVRSGRNHDTAEFRLEGFPWAFDDFFSVDVAVLLGWNVTFTTKRWKSDGNDWNIAFSFWSMGFPKRVSLYWLPGPLHYTFICRDSSFYSETRSPG